jgi:hypothetical protein
MNNKTSIALLEISTLCIAASTFAAPANRRDGKRPHNSVSAQETTEEQKSNEKAKRKIAPYLTDEGADGRLTWREYTVNPKGKGDPTLLVVFGGRDSVKDGINEAKIPTAIEMAISHANLLRQSAKLIILVPDMTLGEARKGHGGRDVPVSDGIPKLVRSRMEKHGIDRKRVFATGFSMGGGLVYNLLNDDPSFFSRVLVVGASGNPTATKDIKVEIFDYHGSDDDYIPVVRVKAFADAVNASHPGLMNVEILSKVGHADSESVAYAKADPWKWLLR